MTTEIITAGSWKGFLGMGLAPRELEATLHAANERTQKEIAKLMGISPRTVEKRIDDARFKLGAKTMRGLVLEAFRRGMIQPAVVAVCAVLVGHSLAAAGDEFTRVRRSGERRIETRAATRRSDCAQAVA
ncbi:response regulator transcription factor [Pseudomonas mosselii]|uniref:response regulator transcription factor n=1 Tax=Pseudomonas mosselii TaxID=78327 RepID=UPI001E43EE73|nr:sigma factor-like helix-turn-helix DNA-binding protein [Pseudomonas mosselii]MCL8303100.1 LuxR C-terminal-related transcriptional regulator [Pseudomonas mosselii]WJR27807.1 sigma factor-like helix-turn-helix DNA-binding protein [Pseudomonas mosselii]